MSVAARIRQLRSACGADDGLTLVIVLAVMLVTSLLVTAAFAANDGDIQLARDDVLEKQAYFAALAGVQQYEYQLQNNPDYWESCAKPSASEESERYEVSVLGANGNAACSSAKPFESTIEANNAVANTFRVVSVGCAGQKALTNCQTQAGRNVKKRAIVATFKVTGFLNYAYFTKYEDEDPYLSGQSKAECERYYTEGSSTRSSSCENITFVKADSVNGPMHTDDFAQVECNKGLVFGRASQVPFDPVEIFGGTSSCPAGSEPTYNTATKKPSKGTELNPPESDSSLKLYVEAENKFAGATHIVLHGNEARVTHYREEANGTLTEVEDKVEPKNGLIYVTGKPSWGCTYVFKIDNSEADSASEEEHEKGCGNVYVEGTYSKPLTIAAENDLIIDGNIQPTGVSAGSAPSGTTTLGLIATDFVRVAHPCSGNVDQSGYLPNPWVYAAILSTAHSFIVDNFYCGNQSKLGTLNVYGAIAQKFRGPVGTSGGTGYFKDYKYDERLATDEPPYFLSPLKAGWKVVRETAATPG
jgi:Tfp pilus assembly protein PilX